MLEADKVVVEPGDMLLLYTGFTDEIVKMNKKVDPARAHAMCCVLDGRDKRLLQWITDSQISALIADNYGVEAVPARPGPDDAEHPSLPIHNHCLFKLGLNLGEIWWLKDLALWLREQEALALPADRAAASPAGRRRLAGDAGGDRLASGMTVSFPALVADTLGTSTFRLLDIGCSGGLDPRWRAFEPELQAIGIDASEGRVRAPGRPSAIPGVSYVAAFVAASRTSQSILRRAGVAADHEGARPTELHAHARDPRRRA